MATFEWRLMRLKDITSKIGSGATPRGGRDSYFSSGISLIRSLNVYDFNLEPNDLAFISEEQAAELNNVVVQKDDILLNITGASVARCCLADPQYLPARVNQHVAIVRVRPDIADARFVLYCINSPHFKSRLLALAQGGATREALTKTTIEGFEVLQPPLPIQRRIADILSAYDELIENSQRRIKILESMARALYREWFVHFRFPGHDSVPRVPSPLGEIPQGWKVVAINDVCAKVTDGAHRSPQSVDEGLPMASSKDMHDWGLNLETARLISSEDFAELAKNDCKPKTNDVLITKDGANYLKHIFVTRQDQEVVLLSSIAILRPNSRINPHLLAATLNERRNKEKLRNYVTGAAIPRVILKDFKQFEILLPSNETQTAWARLAVPITEQIWSLIDKVENLRRTRDLLLPRLLSGQVELASEAS